MCFIISERLKEILNVQFSVVGSNCRRMEEQAWVNFIDFLDDCEGTFMKNKKK